MSPAPTPERIGPDTAETLVERLDALLPQTQCTRCGYAGCRPYAETMASGAAPPNRCPPGGARTIEALAAVLTHPVLPLDPACGSAADPGVAWIDPLACIGCARCLPDCPVDAIVGAQRFLHTVYEPHCTGCELCVAACPVDCIHMRPRSAGGVAPDPADNRLRYQAHRHRRARRTGERAALLQDRKRIAARNAP